MDLRKAKMNIQTDANLDVINKKLTYKSEKQLVVNWAHHYV